MRSSCQQRANKLLLRSVAKAALRVPHDVLLITPPPAWSVSIVMSMSACVSVCQLSACVCLSASISPELHVRSPPNFVHFTNGRSSIVLWRRCGTLCVSGFMDDVMFAYHGQE